jgi:hypothetical protein
LAALEVELRALETEASHAIAGRIRIEQQELPAYRQDFRIVAARGAVTRLLRRELGGPSRTFDRGVRDQRHGSGFVKPEARFSFA